MSRRTRKTARKTPLSALDKLMHFVLTVIETGIIFSAIILFGDVIPDNIAFSDPSVIACDNSIVMLYVMPFILALMILLLSIHGYGVQHKLPFFGNKHYKPKSFEIVIPTYPLFSKEFSLNFSDKAKKSIRRFFCIMLIITAIALVILPFGICRRLTLDTDYIVKIYDSFNRYDTYQWSEAENVRIHIDKGRHSSYYLVFSFEYDNDNYEFRIGSFSEVNRYEALKHMLYLKENSKECTVGSTRRIERLIYEDNYTASEQQLLYRLFDYTP